MNYEVTLIAATTVAVDNCENEAEAIECATDHVSSDFEVHESKAIPYKEDTYEWESVVNCADHKCLD